MAGSTHRCHGNFPQRRAALVLQGLGCRVQLAQEAVSPETGRSLAASAEETPPPAGHISGSGFCEPNRACNRKTGSTSPSSGKVDSFPDESVKSLLSRMSVHPEARRILGNSSVAVVSLERLNFRAVSLSCLQPVVSLVRLPCQKQQDVSLNCPQQFGFSPIEDDMLEIKEEGTSWTKPFCPEGSLFDEPEQDSGFDCDSNPDQPYILFDSGSDDEKGDPETFYLDPDPEQAVVMELDLDTEAGQDRRLKLEDESDPQCEAAAMLERGEARTSGLCCSVKREPEDVKSEEMESEDFCAVCLNGGDLLCCDRCPKVFHLSCHIPRLICFPLGDWLCTMCRSDQEPAQAYDCENMLPCGTVKVPYTLSDLDQRRCERLTLLLYCHTLSAPFHEPVSPLARNYYQIIKRPIDLSVIRRKLNKSNTLHYFTAEQFVDDILLMFRNCATFNYPDSEVAQAGRNLEVFFLSKLKEIFPDRTFPTASQDRTNRARLRWFNRKRKHVFSGKKY